MPNKVGRPRRGWKYNIKIVRKGEVLRSFYAPIEKDSKGALYTVYSGAFCFVEPCDDGYHQFQITAL